jgi:hypothetical protein
MSEAPRMSPESQNVPDGSVQSRSRAVRWLIIASVLLAIMSLSTAFPLMSIGACASWPLTLATAIMSATAWVRARKQHAEPFESIAKRTDKRLLVICLGLLLGSTYLNMQAFATMRVVSKSTMSAASLWGIGASVEGYAYSHATYPPSLEAMVDDSQISPKSLIAPFDPDAPYDVPAGKLIYSSYVYTPGTGKPVADPDLVIAYERGPFTICEPRLFAPKERWVLFGNGQVRHLTDAEFAEAMGKDKKRRQELGWPPATAPATSSTGEAQRRP